MMILLLDNIILSIILEYEKLDENTEQQCYFYET